MGKFVKRQNAIGWDWYLETDDESSWVSHMVKEYIERLEAENAKLRELVKALLQCHVEDTDTCAKCSYRSQLHGGCMADVNADELGVVL